MAVDSAEGSILRGQLVDLHGRDFADGGTVEAWRRQALRTYRAEKAGAHGRLLLLAPVGTAAVACDGSLEFVLSLILVGW